MTINFHDAANANTYASRDAHSGWYAQMQFILDGRQIGTVVDIGCGGGIYSRAWRELGASSVIGLDSSSQMIADAQSATDDAGARFAVADASSTGLEVSSCDIVFSRAVIHHLEDHRSAMNEALRILKPGGLLSVQDRTIEDVLQPASPQHLRAHFFDAFPRLIDVERQRRPVTEEFTSVLVEVGFHEPVIRTFWETRRIYQSEDDLGTDLRARTGRSILHNLDDTELESLIRTILKASEGRFPLEERDRWTVWTATKPVEG